MAVLAALFYRVNGVQLLVQRVGLSLNPRLPDGFVTEWRRGGFSCAAIWPRLIRCDWKRGKVDDAMTMIARCLLVLGLFAAFPALAQQDAQQEPSGRVGRVSVISGTLAFYGPGDTEWSAAQVNLPAATGGWFATDPKSRAQLRIGADAITLANDTQLNIADLRDGVMQIALSQGRIGLQLHRPAWRKDQTAEIDVARGGVWLLQPGDYDIDSGAADQPTRITVFEGSARFVGGGVDKVVNAGERAGADRRRDADRGGRAGRTRRVRRTGAASTASGRTGWRRRATSRRR